MDRGVGSDRSERETVADGGVDTETAPSSRASGEESSDAGGRTGDRSLDVTGQAIVVGIGIGVGVFAYLLVGMLTDALSGAAVSVIGEPGTILGRTLETVGLGLGMVTGAGVYLVVFDRGLEYVDLRRPSRRAMGYVLAAVLVSFATSMTVTTLVEILEFEAARSGSEGGEQVPALYLVLMALSIGIIGPAEELVYRNVVQKSIAEAVSLPVGIGVATVVYVAVHVPALFLGGGSVTAVLPAVVVLTVLSVALGMSYARTENLVVPALAHGLYNALLFGTDYLWAIGLL